MVWFWIAVILSWIAFGLPLPPVPPVAPPFLSSSLTLLIAPKSSLYALVNTFIPLPLVFASFDDSALKIELSLVNTPELSKAINIICCFADWRFFKNGAALTSSFLNISISATFFADSSRPFIVSNTP